MSNFLAHLALDNSREKGASIAIMAAGLVLVGYKWGRDRSNNNGVGVTSEQMAALRAEIANVQRNLEGFKVHVFSILDEQTALTFAADVFGVEQSLRAWTETGDPDAAKGALALVESIEYRFVMTLRSPPDFMSDETVVTLGKLYTVHMLFRLTIHVLNGLDHWTDSNAETLRHAAADIGKTMIKSQTMLRMQAYSLCLGAYNDDVVSAGGRGEPRHVSYTQEYGLSMDGGTCEIVHTARWYEFSIGNWSDTGWARSRVTAIRNAIEAVESEIQHRAANAAQADLAEELAFLQQIVAD